MTILYKTNYRSIYFSNIKSLILKMDKHLSDFMENGKN